MGTPQGKAKGAAAKDVGKAAAKDAGAGAAPKVRWAATPEEKDFPAAAAYLSLLTDPATIDATVAALRAAETTYHAAKDILRAARLPLLGTDNPHVRSDLHKIARGERLSPVLLVRGAAATGVPLLVADGYHRVCASYHTSENTSIPALLVPLGTPA